MYEWIQPDGKEVPLSQLAKAIGVEYNTVWQWANKGRQGVKLRVCRLPSGLGSSMDEYRSFLERLSQAIEAKF